MDKVLVSGGLGFIGSCLTDKLLKSGFNVRIFDKTNKPADLPQVYEYLQGDVSQKEAWIKALGGVDYVLHLATYPGNSSNFSNYFTVNTAGTALIYEAVLERQLPIKQITIASSRAVYGEGKYKCADHGIFYPQRRLLQLKKQIWDVPCPHCGIKAEVLPSKEEDALFPLSPYGISKAALDQLALALGREYNIPTTVLRYSKVIGAHALMRANYSDVFTYCIEKAQKREGFVFHEDGLQTLDLIDVRDVAEAHLAVLDNPKSYGEAYNVASGSMIKIKDLASSVCAFLKIPCSISFCDEPKSFSERNWSHSIKKICSLGWKPHHDMEESIKSYLSIWGNRI